MNIWLKVMMVVVMFVVVVTLGYLLGLEYVGELQSFYDEHGYYPEPGPGFTDVRLMVVLVGVAGGVVTALLLGFSYKKEDS